MGHRTVSAAVLALLFAATFSLGPSPRAQGSYPGDCSGDWTVSIGEVQRSVNMFLGVEAPACGADANGDGAVSIGEVQKVINCFLGDCPAPVLVGLDTDGDGEAEIEDADGNGLLDAAFPADCAASAPYSLRIVARYAGPDPVFQASGLPAGMSFQPDGGITYLPSCADEGTTFSPQFFLSGQAQGLAAPFLVTRSVHPAIVGLDTDGDGAADLVDGDGDGILDPTFDADCNHPVPYRLRLIAKDAADPPTFGGSSLPYGMELSADGTVTFTPTCDSSGLTYMPSFSVDGSSRVFVRFKVVRLPWLALDIDGDGLAEARDADGTGRFSCDMALLCGASSPTTFTLVAHDAGSTPVFTAADLEGWMVVSDGNRIAMTPPCDGVEGSTFYPKFTVEGPGGIRSPTVTLTVPVYREDYDFEAAGPWYSCPQGSFPTDATVVTAFDRVYHYFNGYEDNRQDIYNEVDFPAEGTWSQVGLLVRLECPESGLCDWWDRLGSVLLILNPDDPPEQWLRLEVGRYITAYRIPMCQYIDVTPLASLLRGHRLLLSNLGTWVGPGNSSGEGWRLTAQFVFYPGPSRAADQVADLYRYQTIVVGQVDPSQNVDSQTPPACVDIPADAWRVEAHFLTTGHSFNNTKNCAEFCQMRQDLYVNGTRISVNPWRGDCSSNPVSPQYGTWKYARNGWCPGAVAVGQVVDITDQLVRGGSNTFDFDIRLADGAEYDNTAPDPWLPNEVVTLRLLIYR